jgi:hypothetical protein
MRCPTDAVLNGESQPTITCISIEGLRIDVLTISKLYWNSYENTYRVIICFITKDKEGVQGNSNTSNSRNRFIDGLSSSKKFFRLELCQLYLYLSMRYKWCLKCIHKIKAPSLLTPIKFFYLPLINRGMYFCFYR